MKEIQTNGITILLVEVPEDAKEFQIRTSSIGDLFYKTNQNDIGYGKATLPIGQYLILGKSTELSEEQMKEIITLYEGKKYKVYTGSYGKYTDKVQESYLSLLEANGIVDRNPYELPESGRDKLYDSSETHGRSQVYHEQWHTRMKQWQEAQSIVKTYIVLKRI